MKAIICPKYGPPDVLKIVEMAKPVPKDNQVLIKNFAITVTVADCRVRGFNVPVSFWLPARLALGFTRPRQAILGGELSGIIESIGKGVKKYKTGDKVFAFLSHKFGAYAEFVCVDENNCIAAKPENLSFEQSASLSFGGITALHFLTRANVKQGENIMIYGASGSVGTYAVQLAKYFSATVTGVCSTSNLEMVKNLGADKVIDYTTTDLAEITDKFDAVFDTVGKTDISKAISLIKPTGRYIHAVTSPGTEIKIRFKLFNSNIKLIGGTFTSTPEQINLISKLASEGHIFPVIDRQYSFEEIVEAHRYVDKGHKKGNVIVKVT